MVMGVIGLVHLISLYPVPTISIKVNSSGQKHITKGPPIKPVAFYFSEKLYPLGEMDLFYTSIFFLSFILFTPH